MLETESGNLERPRLGTVDEIAMPRLHKGARNYMGILPLGIKLWVWIQGKLKRGPAFDGFLASEVYRKALECCS